MDVVAPEAKSFSKVLLAGDAGGVVGFRFVPKSLHDSTYFSFKTLVDSLLYGTRTSLGPRMEASQESNFQIFRDCLSTPLIEKSAEQPVKRARKARGRKTAIKPIKHEIEEPNDTEELAEFIDVCPYSINHSVSSIDTQAVSRPRNLHQPPHLSLHTLILHLAQHTLSTITV
jgi:hypothetical protein